MPDSIQSLIADLESNDIGRRVAATEAAARMGSEASPAVVALALAAGDADAALSQAAAGALEGLGPLPASELNALAALLDGKNSDVDYWVATLLGRLGEQSAPAVDVLSRALNDSTLPARQRCAWALEQIGAAAIDARLALEKAASDADSRLARLAQRALQSING